MDFEIGVTSEVSNIVNAAAQDVAVVEHRHTNLVNKEHLGFHYH